MVPGIDSQDPAKAEKPQAKATETAQPLLCRHQTLSNV
jgi:hypothetical protein